MGLILVVVPANIQTDHLMERSNICDTKKALQLNVYYLYICTYAVSGNLILRLRELKVYQLFLKKYTILSTLYLQTQIIYLNSFQPYPIISCCQHVRKFRANKINKSNGRSPCLETSSLLNWSFTIVEVLLF